MIAAGGEKRRLAAIALCKLEAEDVAIESKRAIEVGDLEMHVPDPDTLINRARR
jgi:hypothetical protein